MVLVFGFLDRFKMLGFFFFLVLGKVIFRCVEFLENKIIIRDFGKVK